MDGLNKSNCSYAKDGTCRLSADNCPACKLTKGDSDFHATLCIGAYTFEDVQRMQRGLPRRG